MGKIILIHLISYTKAEEELGPIFILANNAGYSRAAKFEDTPVEEIKVFLVYSTFEENLSSISYKRSRG